jgi:hypothetical protein
MQTITIILGVFALFALSRVILRFKDGKLKLYELLFWIIIWGGALTVLLFPQLIVTVQLFFGITPNSGVLSLFGMVILFYLVFRLYVKLEQQNQAITKLVRESSISHAKHKKK